MNTVLMRIDDKFSAGMSLPTIRTLESDINHVTWSEGAGRVRDRVRGSNIIRVLKFRRANMSFIDAWYALFDDEPSPLAQRVLLDIILPA
jgi:hypothetical protein